MSEIIFAARIKAYWYRGENIVTAPIIYTFDEVLYYIYCTRVLWNAQRRSGADQCGLPNDTTPLHIPASNPDHLIC
jgi:hypothetical protein